MRQVAIMDYGNNTCLASSDPLKRPSAGVVGVPARQSEQNKSGKPAAAVIACDIKHPLAAILANANAARRWLNGPDASLAEAITALDQIATDVTRIDAAVDIICALAAEPGG